MGPPPPQSSTQFTPIYPPLLSQVKGSVRGEYNTDSFLSLLSFLNPLGTPASRPFNLEGRPFDLLKVLEEGMDTIKKRVKGVVTLGVKSRMVQFEREARQQQRQQQQQQQLLPRNASLPLQTQLSSNPLLPESTNLCRHPSTKVLINDVIVPSVIKALTKCLDPKSGTIPLTVLAVPPSSSPEEGEGSSTPTPTSSAAPPSTLPPSSSSFWAGDFPTKKEFVEIRNSQARKLYGNKSTSTYWSLTRYHQSRSQWDEMSMETDLEIQALKDLKSDMIKENERLMKERQEVVNTLTKVEGLGVQRMMWA